MTKRNVVAADIHKHLCDHSTHGYTQGYATDHDRWGSGGTEKVTVDGETFNLGKYDYDCSSSVCKSWQLALKGTKYEGKLDKATYTGNMRSVFVGSGLFEWKPVTFTPSRGDVFLNEKAHTAMEQGSGKQSAFCIDENGNVIGGKKGDQTGRESWIQPHSAYTKWNGILHYNGKADPATTKPATTDKATTTAKTTYTKYKVTVGVGLNYRTGAGTSYKVKGAYPVGTVLKISQTKKVGSKTWGKASNGYWSCLTGYTKKV